MSAFICSNAHIATIAVAYTRLLGQDEEAQALANELLAENIRSVNYRYSEDTAIEPCDITDHEASTRTLAELIALCECLDYQSCEHPGYHTSKAKALIELIIAQFRATAVATGARHVRQAGVWAI